MGATRISWRRLGADSKILAVVCPPGTASRDLGWTRISGWWLGIDSHTRSVACPIPTTRRDLGWIRISWRWLGVASPILAAACPPQQPGGLWDGLAYLGGGLRLTRASSGRFELGLTRIFWWRPVPPPPGFPTTAQSIIRPDRRTHPTHPPTLSFARSHRPLKSAVGPISQHLSDPWQPQASQTRRRPGRLGAPRQRPTWERASIASV